jgi:hypothetical protein
MRLLSNGPDDSWRERERDSCCRGPARPGKASCVRPWHRLAVTPTATNIGHGLADATDACRLRLDGLPSVTVGLPFGSDCDHRVFRQFATGHATLLQQLGRAASSWQVKLAEH